MHANTPRDALARLETLVLMGGIDLPIKAIREQIASAVHMIVQQTRFARRQPRDHGHHRGLGHGGRRRSPSQDIFYFKQEGFDDEGKVKGRFVADWLRARSSTTTFSGAACQST